ncbi:sensor histidine kinase [Jiulongibacter sediminis]|uniref:histidine kinase n=1 Tax=Jiulongibacter sediminis TaxID=1605367 RepID=A0A0P7BQG0_9BACT|nr:HAMP domain-containing sensor histidine kinase [Jiulongibacter sediminis]KPM47448.1 histidine kinase [Jiulongibacter sediminis]TBX23243.1 histidine kinase [Jiulongibacter sediminis]
MTRNTIRLIIVLGSLAIAGILAVQIYWVKRAYDIESAKFRQTAIHALSEVANNISRVYELADIENPVEQLSSDYYVVNLRTPLDAEVLEHYLKLEFKEHDLNTDFEYGIYDCDTDEIRYGARVTANFVTNTEEPIVLPKTDKFLNYFAVKFPNSSEMLFKNLDFWILSSLITLLVMGFFVYAMVVILRQKRLSEVQRDFVNNMTHEFQTPISTIRVATDVLTQPKILDQPERLKKYVQIIRQENNRLKSQVETVLTTAKVGRGKLQLDVQMQELHSLINEVLEGVKAEHGEGLKLKLNADRTTIFADRVHLLSVIRNLVENAIKYSKKPFEITVETKNTQNGIILSVSDKGIGIPKEYLNKIFNKFYRVPTGNVHNVKGFGLGLNYVQQIVKAHKWTINVISEYGEGSTFSIHIPQEN